MVWKITKKLNFCQGQGKVREFKISGFISYKSDFGIAPRSFPLKNLCISKQDLVTHVEK